MNVHSGAEIVPKFSFFKESAKKSVQFIYKSQYKVKSWSFSTEVQILWNADFS